MAVDAACRRRSRRRATADGDASASAIRCAPPRGIGQPATWHSAPSVRPTPAVSARSSGSMPCAAMPANSARVRSSANALVARPRPTAAPAGRSARAQPDGAAIAAGRAPRARAAANRRRPRRSACVGVAVPARAARPSLRAIAPRPRRPRRRTDAPASPAARSIRARAPRAAASARTATRRANGWTAEQMSCENPGSVSSADRAPPPMRLVRFEHHDLAPGLRQDDGGAQAVRPRTDDDGIDVTAYGD